MNFRTTLVLLATLLIVGAVLLFTRKAGEKVESPPTAKLFDFTSADVTRLVIAPENDQPIHLEKSAGKWQITEPVKTVAEGKNVNSLLDGLAALDSRGRIDAGGANAPTTGLDQPKFQIEIDSLSGKSYKLDVGNRSGAGDNVYVKLDGQSQADIVPASILEQLDRPLKQWRREKLLDVGAPQINHLRIATTQQTIDLQKSNDNWTIGGPTTMPGDTSEISDLTLALANMRAADFVDDENADPKRFGLDRPVVEVSFDAQSSTTQPATQPVTTSLRFGRFDDVMRKNVYAKVSDQPGIVKVAASVVDTFRKTSFDLRDKTVFSIDAERVNRITIETSKPATTQPTTRAASSSQIVLERRQTPETMPATTQATTAPAQSKWIIASQENISADDAKVDALLRELHPLRASRYLQTRATTSPAATYHLSIETSGGNFAIELIDPGNSQPLVGSYNDLTFEVVRWVTQQLQADFSHKTETPPRSADEP